ncbi:unnamed protein product, partial [Mesorhabditis spiculigera]
MSARCSALLALTLLIVHLDFSRAVKCYKCSTMMGSKSESVNERWPPHPDCLQGSKELPACGGTHCVAIMGANGTSMLRFCSDGPTQCGKYEGGGVVTWSCDCSTDLCNDWDPATLKAKTSSNTTFLIAIAVVVAKMLANF